MVDSTTSARDRQQTVATSIHAVTVYTDWALVVRRGKVQFTDRDANAPSRDFVVADIPVVMLPESARARGKGAPARILAVRTVRTYATTPVEERTAQLTQQIENLEFQKQNLLNHLDSLGMQRDFVKGLSDRAIERFARELASQQSSIDRVREMLHFVGTQYNEYVAAITQGKREDRELDRQIMALRQQQQDLESLLPTERYNLIVTLEVAAEGEFELEVSYVTRQARWKPLYDLQVGNDSLQLQYLAEVQQHTGEDWMAAQVTLSTAKPSLGTLPPRLDPWYIDEARPIAPAMAAPTMKFGAARARSSGDYSETGDDDTTIVMQSVAPDAASYATAEIETAGGIVTFQIDRLCDIPSDNAPHKLSILEANFPCRMEWVAIPKLVSYTYLQAEVSNPADGVTLLAGQANIFRDNTFVGTSQLENVVPGQTFKLLLGVDESVQISRQLAEREVDKRFIGGQRRTTYAYRLAIANLGEARYGTDEPQRPKHFRLLEQLPTSRNEQIKVRLIGSNPQIKPGELGLLEWSFILSPHAKQEVYYQFSVDYPPELTVVGLNI